MLTKYLITVDFESDVNLEDSQIIIRDEILTSFPSVIFNGEEDNEVEILINDVEIQIID